MPDRPKNTDQPASANFLKRWSDRKASASDPTTLAETVDETATTGSSQQVSPAGNDATVAKTLETDAENTPPPVTEADLENLSYESDYTKFMAEHVPEALRRQALRQLWRSDPVLANLDGLCDYNDDYTDAALAVKVLKTAHKVGQGYLTDEDLAANRARGEPPPPAAGEERPSEAPDTEDEAVAAVDDDNPTDDAVVAEASTDETTDAAQVQEHQAAGNQAPGDQAPGGQEHAHEPAADPDRPESGST